MNKINLKGMQFFGYHGVFKFEEEEGQPFIVDLSLHLDLIDAGKSDELQKTISYAEVFESVKYCVEDKRFQLIEALAYDIMSTIFKEYSEVDHIEVEVKKPNAPIDGNFGYASVSLSHSRYMFEESV